MTNDYLPKHATTPDACNWLQAQTGQTWTLARLVESGLIPWFWLDYTPGWPAAIFGNRVEGYLAPMVFAGDTQRLEADGSDALVNMTRTHDGVVMKVEPGIKVPIADLRFKREDLQALSDAIVKTAPAPEPQQPAPGQNTATPAPAVAESGSGSNGQTWKSSARARAVEIIKRDGAKDLYPNQKDIADEIAREFRNGGVMGPAGKPLTGSYIKRHALNGISSARGKQLSTPIRRGK